MSLVRSELVRDAGLPSAATDVALSISGLARDLYDMLAEQAGNLVFSPYSVAVALGMTVNGAVGTTADEMRGVLHADDLETFNRGLNALTQGLEGLAGKQEQFGGEEVEIVLDTANSLWGQDGVSWEKPFLDTLARDYGTGLRTVDFQGATEDARRLINRWTAEHTHERIPELVPSGVLDAMTRLVLVNAIYLKAPWRVPFEERLTQEAPFHLADGSVIDVPMMAGADANLPFKQGDGWQAVRLPYAGGQLAMTVVLHDDPGGVVMSEGIEGLVGWMPDDSVGLRLPRWRFRLQSSLDDALARLGMPTAFTPGADFSRMTQSQLMIQAVLHEAFVAVDEKGTEAAAATAVAMRLTSARLEPRVVTVDRPFLFVIHDVQEGAPLFVGRVTNPLDKEG